MPPAPVPGDGQGKYATIVILSGQRDTNVKVIKMFNPVQIDIIVFCVLFLTVSKFIEMLRGLK